MMFHGPFTCFTEKVGGKKNATVTVHTKAPGVHAVDPWNALRGQPIAQRADAAVVRGFVGIVRNHHALQVDPEIEIRV